MVTPNFQLKSRISTQIRSSNSCPGINDKEWLIDLAFSSGIIEKLYSSTLVLEENDETIIDMISSLKSFKKKLSMLLMKLGRRELT